MESAVTPLDTLPCNIESRLNIHGIRVYTEHMHNATRNESHINGTELPTHSFWVNVVCGTSSLLGGLWHPMCDSHSRVFQFRVCENKRHYCENRIKGEETKIRHVYIPPEPLGHMPNVLFLMPVPKDGCVLSFVLYRGSHATRAYGSC